MLWPGKGKGGLAHGTSSPHHDSHPRSVPPPAPAPSSQPLPPLLALPRRPISSARQCILGLPHRRGRQLHVLLGLRGHLVQPGQNAVGESRVSLGRGMQRVAHERWVDSPRALMLNPRVRL